MATIIRTVNLAETPLSPDHWAKLDSLCLSRRLEPEAWDGETE